MSDHIKRIWAAEDLHSALTADAFYRNDDARRLAEYLAQCTQLMAWLEQSEKSYAATCVVKDDLLTGYMKALSNARAAIEAGEEG